MPKKIIPQVEKVVDSVVNEMISDPPMKRKVGKRKSEITRGGGKGDGDNNENVAAKKMKREDKEEEEKVGD